MGARWLETDSLSNQDISSALEIGSYTAAADRLLVVQAFVDAVAGNGDYIFYATLQINGAGSAYRFIPITTAAAASGVTAIGVQAVAIGVRNGDIVKVYVDGLAGDTTTPDSTVRFFEDASLLPATADRTIAVDASGYTSANVVQLSGDGTAADNAEAFFDGTGYAGTNNVIPTVTTVTTVTNLTNERGKYAMGAVWIGPAANTNTASYVDGIITNPVSTLAAAKTIADALGLRRFYTIRTGATQLGADYVGYDFDGNAWSCTTTGGSRDVSSSNFVNAKVIGGTYASTTAESHWMDCEFSDGVSVAAVHMVRCTFAGTLTLNAAGNYDFIDCASVVAGTSTPTFAIPAGTVNVSFRRWSGGITITGITADTTISIDMVSGGTVTLEGANGNVQVRGLVAGITDSRTGTPTLGQNAAVNITKITAAVPTATQNADELLKRDWTQVSGEAARSVLNALRFLRNKWSISSTTLTVTEEDDSTPAWTSELTTNANADPVTASDPT